MKNRRMTKVKGLRAGVVALIVIVTGCGGSEDKADVPAEIVGTWMTEESLFRDRAFEITDSEVFFQTGPKDYTLHQIQMVERVERGDETDYEIEYRGVSGERERFRFTRHEDNTLRFENRPLVVWAHGDPALDWPWKVPGQ